MFQPAPAVLLQTIQLDWAGELIAPRLAQREQRRLQGLPQRIVNYIGRRIAHGALMVGYMSTCSTMMIEQCKGATSATTPVSLGYDRVRFLAPVFIGDTVTLTYTIAEIDPQKRRSVAEINAVNQHGTLVAIARHLLAWVENTG